MTVAATKPAPEPLSDDERAMVVGLRILLRDMGARNELYPRRKSLASVMSHSADTLERVRKQLTLKELAMVGEWRVVSVSDDV